MTLTIAIIFVTVTARWTGVDLFAFPISTLLLRFRSGLMVSSSDCGVRGPTQVRISPRTAVFITTASFAVLRTDCTPLLQCLGQLSLASLPGH